MAIDYDAWRLAEPPAPPWDLSLVRSALINLRNAHSRLRRSGLLSAAMDVRLEAAETEVEMILEDLG